MKRVALRIAGRVQGIGFRFTAGDEARRLGVTGLVRNTHDGDVELVAEGAEQSLRQLVTWCHHGPPGARVTSVQEAWQDAADEFVGFETRR